MSDLGNYVLQLEFGHLANDALSLVQDIAESLTTILTTFLKSLTMKFQRSTASNPASPLPSTQFLGQDLSTHLPVASSSDLQSIHVVPSYPPMIPTSSSISPFPNHRNPTPFPVAHCQTPFRSPGRSLPVNVLGGDTITVANYLLALGKRCINNVDDFDHDNNYETLYGPTGEIRPPPL